MRQFKHLSLTERELLYGWQKEGIKIREIARRLGRQHSSLLRELQRNRVGKGRKAREYFNQPYMPALADEKAIKRALRQRQKAPLKNPAVFLYVREHLVYPYYWTPEEIHGKLSLEHPDQSIGTETIYQYIYSKKGRRYKLWRYLPNGRKKRMTKGGRRVQRDGRIADAISIDLRPEIVSSRARGGDWESDNLGGKTTDKTALSVTVERVTRYTILNKLSNRLASTKRGVLVRRLGVYPNQLRLTLTVDNGSENTEHMKLSEELQMMVYFCHAYHSWEKGSVENINQMMRRFIPKGTSIDDITEERINEIERILNNTPRKCLGYLTPQEKMLQLLQSGST